jgi:hypothetical protein
MSTDNVFGVLNQQAIILAVKALQHDDETLLDQFGLTELDSDLAHQLKDLSIDHLNCTNSFRGSLLELKFDPRQLKLFINMAFEKTREDDQVNRAIRAGLRQPMLEEIKGITRREFATRRQRMGLPEHSKGRIENLGEDDELLVLRTWSKLKEINDPLTKYLTLFDETNISLDRAWVTLKQLEG